MDCVNCGNKTRKLELYLSVVDHCDYCEGKDQTKDPEYSKELTWYFDNMKWEYRRL